MSKNNILRVLMISTDRGLLGQDQLGDVVSRHTSYAKSVDRLDIIVLSKKGYTSFTLSEASAAYPTNSLLKLFYIADAYNIAKTLFKKNHYDLVVTQDPYVTGYVGALLRKKYNSKLLVHFHGDFLDNEYYKQRGIMQFILKVMMNNVIKSADAFRVMSAAQKEKLEKRNISTNKIRVIPTPVNIEKFSNASIQGVLYPFKKTVLMVGRKDPVKDFETLFRAMNIVFNKYKDVGLVLVGNYLNNDDIPLTPERVHVYGNIKSDKLPAYYSNADIVVLSSRAESFGKVLVEAAASGKPVVATETSGANEIVKNNRTGYLVPIGDANTLAKKILVLLKNKNEALVMGDNAKKDIQSRFSNNTEKITMYWKNIIEENL